MRKKTKRKRRKGFVKIEEVRMIDEARRDERSWRLILLRRTCKIVKLDFVKTRRNIIV